MKFAVNKRAGQYTIIPNSILASEISFGAKVIYALLLMYAQQKRYSPSQKQLAEVANCTERTVRKYLKELRNAGLLNWKQRGLTQTNVYFPRNQLGR